MVASAPSVEGCVLSMLSVGWPKRSKSARGVTLSHEAVVVALVRADEMLSSVSCWLSLLPNTTAL